MKADAIELPDRTTLAAFAALSLIGGLNIVGREVQQPGAGAPVRSGRPTLLAAIGAAASGVESGVVMKMFPRLTRSRPTLLGWASALLLFVFSAASGEPWTVPTTSSTWAAFGCLVTIGSVGLFGLFLFTLKRWSA